MMSLVTMETEWPRRIYILSRLYYIDFGPRSPLEAPQTLLPLVLDSALLIPVVLKDIHPPNSVLRDMNKATNGPPGKFYKEQHALVMLDTLQVTGSYARVLLDQSSSEDQQRHFAKFSERLKAGELVRPGCHLRLRNHDEPL